MKKRVLISTYCRWKSIGSLLQSYALKHFLQEKLSTDSIIVYEKDFPTILKKKKNRGSLISIFKLTIKKTISGFKEKDRFMLFKKNHSFMNDYIDFIFFDGKDSFIKSPIANSFDLFIAGSDQIFNADVCNLNPLFYFDGCDKIITHKISYAASMGNTKVEPNKEQLFCKMLQNFDSISVREEDNVPVIKKYYSKTVDRHIDPTFLIDADEWRKIQIKYNIDCKYYLVYPIYWDSKLNSELKQLEKKTGCKILVVAYEFTRAYGKKLTDVGASEFLWLIDHAEGVITSSFHGAALSVIFNKDLVIVTNPNLPSRLDGLKKTLGLEPLSVNELGRKHVDYTIVNRNIEIEKKRSYNYLKGWIYEK